MDCVKIGLVIFASFPFIVFGLSRLNAAFNASAAAAAAAERAAAARAEKEAAAAEKAAAAAAREAEERRRSLAREAAAAAKHARQIEIIDAKIKLEQIKRINRCL